MNYLENQHGLTLVETIVALVLVLLLVTAFAGAMTAGLQREVEVDHSLKAADLAASIMEYLGEDDDRRRVKDITNNQNGEVSLLELQDEGFALTEELKFAGLNESETIIYVDDTQFEGIPNLYRVNVEIYWDEIGTKISYKLTSLLFVVEE